jgi:type IV secretory pathway TraG/TraD family ATPase VirD4
MMVALFWAMAQTRISINEDDRKDYTLYIDEFQNFVTDSFSQMLEEARKYRLRLVLANQYTKQIKHKNEAVFDSIK